MYDLDTRDKQKPHYGMDNLNSRQEETKKKKKKNSTTRKGKQMNKKNNSMSFLGLR